MPVIKSFVMLAVLVSTASAGPASDACSQRCSKIDPGAMTALDRMGEFLRAQQSFTIRTMALKDYVLDNGQKVQLASRGTLEAQRPNRLRITTTSDRKRRQFFYDGKTFTVYAPRVGFYAQTPAPPTIGQLADTLEQQKGLELPLADLFRWGTPQSAAGEITAAMDVGPATVNGIACEQYAFRQPGLDWQIWIERGPRPLPRKLLLTTTDDPARPEYTVNLLWELRAHHDNATFTFVPPRGAQQIAMVDTNPTTKKPADEARATRNARR